MSSSDEAPEEVTFNESKLAQRLQEKKIKQADAAARHESKQKRRDRDQKLKQQQQGSTKKKLLSEILQEAASDEDQDDESFLKTDAIEPILAISQPPVRQKKSFVVKDGYTVKVSDSRPIKKKKQLPPAGSYAVNKREQFLFRESVPRK